TASQQPATIEAAQAKARAEPILFIFISSVRESSPCKSDIGIRRRCDGRGPVPGGSLPHVHCVLTGAPIVLFPGRRDGRKKWKNFCALSLCRRPTSVIMTAMLSQLDKGAMASVRSEKQSPAANRKRR